MIKQLATNPTSINSTKAQKSDTNSTASASSLDASWILFFLYEKYMNINTCSNHLQKSFSPFFQQKRTSASWCVSFKLLQVPRHWHQHVVKHCLSLDDFDYEPPPFPAPFPVAKTRLTERNGELGELMTSKWNNGIFSKVSENRKHHLCGSNDFDLKF